MNFSKQRRSARSLTTVQLFLLVACATIHVSVADSSLLDLIDQHVHHINGNQGAATSTQSTGGSAFSHGSQLNAAGHRSTRHMTADDESDQATVLIDSVKRATAVSSAARVRQHAALAARRILQAGVYPSAPITPDIPVPQVSLFVTIQADFNTIVAQTGGVAAFIAQVQPQVCANAIASSSVAADQIESCTVTGVTPGSVVVSFLLVFKQPVLLSQAQEIQLDVQPAACDGFSSEFKRNWAVGVCPPAPAGVPAPSPRPPLRVLSPPPGIAASSPPSGTMSSPPAFPPPRRRHHRKDRPPTTPTPTPTPNPSPARAHPLPATRPPPASTPTGTPPATSPHPTHKPSHHRRPAPFRVTSPPPTAASPTPSPIKARSPPTLPVRSPPAKKLLAPPPVQQAKCGNYPNLFMCSHGQICCTIPTAWGRPGPKGQCPQGRRVKRGAPTKRYCVSVKTCPAIYK